MTDTTTPVKKLLTDLTDDNEIGHLLANGWQHTGDDRWMPPCTENLAAFTRAEALAAQRVIDSGMVVSRDQLGNL